MNKLKISNEEIYERYINSPKIKNLVHTYIKYIEPVKNVEPIKLDLLDITDENEYVYTYIENHFFIKLCEDNNIILPDEFIQINSNNIKYKYYPIVKIIEKIVDYIVEIENDDSLIALDRFCIIRYTLSLINELLQLMTLDTFESIKGIVNKHFKDKGVKYDIIYIAGIGRIITQVK